MSDFDTLTGMGFEPARIRWAIEATGSKGLQQAMDHILQSVRSVRSLALLVFANMSDFDTLTGMGFEPARIRWAIEATGSKGLQQAMDHILVNQNRNVPDYLAGSTSSLSTAAPVGQQELALESAHSEQNSNQSETASVSRRPVATQHTLSVAPTAGRCDGSSSAAALPPPPPSSQTTHTTSSSYTFPPLHSFPPFFTPQSHAETWSTQATNWSSIIRSWCKHHRRFFLDAKGEWERGGADGLFESRICARRLDERAIERILAFMVERGDATWDPSRPSKPKVGAALSTRALIFWYRPEEWADQIYIWVSTVVYLADQAPSCFPSSISHPCHLPC
ncbi:Uncharacterized conserved protein [Ceraceosorus bombacis]|uniref:Uncharacterized conserved protein n=1 Tax=Ceraceosorus bombacis TaxID=401625 RepID=A0A0P1BE72_9BASI|nr:Uncharacterized conserved protein [Ceraceosorus bombacis]